MGTVILGFAITTFAPRRDIVIPKPYELALLGDDLVNGRVERLPILDLAGLSSPLRTVSGASADFTDEFASASRMDKPSLDRGMVSDGRPPSSVISAFHHATNLRCSGSRFGDPARQNVKVLSARKGARARATPAFCSLQKF
jgi:hypothetical protein